MTYLQIVELHVERAFKMLNIIFLIILVFSASVSAQGNTTQSAYELNIIHYNDFHARFVETSPFGGACNPAVAPCIGGFARLATTIRDSLAEDPESLVLNGGDSFQGTIWYNLLRWNVTYDFMNMIPHTAHAFGNHEFDNGIDGVVPYLENLDAPMLAANILDDEEPTIQGLFQPSIVVTKNGRRVGIIGVLIASTNILAATGNLRFTDEVEAVRREAQLLHDDGVDIIVVLSHCGIEIDRVIAREAGPYIDIIVGGHSHSLLFNGEPPQDSSFKPVGSYPVVVEQDGKSVLIVQAAAHTQYLGEIRLLFDENGNLFDWSGEARYLGNEIIQAPDVLTKINEYLPIVSVLANQELGSSRVYLSATCTCRECNLGNMICDAFLEAAMEYAEAEQWNAAHACAINQGGIRTDMPQGVITMESLLLAQPFENNVELFELRGDHVLAMLEHALAGDRYPGANMVQVGGMRVVLDGALPVGSRVVNASIRCVTCDVPRYEPVVPENWYSMVTTEFMASGGDGFSMISENKRNVQVIGVDYAILVDYIEKNSPLVNAVDGRIQISNACV
ncbi:apyrase [Plutella xylostella]|uniref:apyrase n=1 Tax=Plutella xylostella TaxID=51655 RepID=UPI002032FDFF|nr:apyrase [Plutella xylostella]